MADDFEDLASAAASDLVPCSNSLTTFLKRVFGDNDAAVAAMASNIRDEILVQVQNDYDELKKAVEFHGKRLDDLDSLTVAGHLDRLGKEMFRTSSEDKRRALVAVTAGQFAPVGSRGSRHYWLSKVAELTDLQAEAMTMLMGGNIIAFRVNDHKAHVLSEDQWQATAPNKKKDEDVGSRVSQLSEGIREDLSNQHYTHALDLALTSLSRENYVRLHRTGSARLARLIPVGEQLAVAMRGWKDAWT